jgi:hypothetical protein
VSSSVDIIKIYNESFRINKYTESPFRAIGLVDVGIKYNNETERVTLAYYRSSGKNGGKIKGLWYPIIGIKTSSGGFTEFTEFLNHVLNESTKSGGANRGWLAKSLFFSKSGNVDLRGFSNGKYHESLLQIGKTLRNLYAEEMYNQMFTLDAENLNRFVLSGDIYPGNKYSQRDNFEKFIRKIYNETIRIKVE